MVVAKAKLRRGRDVPWNMNPLGNSPTGSALVRFHLQASPGR